MIRVSLCIAITLKYPLTLVIEVILHLISFRLKSMPPPSQSFNIELESFFTTFPSNLEKDNFRVL